MKLTRFFSTLLLISSLSMMMTFTTSCATEGCTDPNSDNYDVDAKKDDGSCIPSRDKFIGQYTVSESCPSGNYTFEINIVASASADNAIIINNLGDLGAAVNATVSQSSVTIPNQNITASGFAVSVNGSGSINGNLLIINYSYNFSGGGETCSMNSTKR
ncbi:MAG: hypothetical protein R3D00_02145 [Bacteroidia bacterium]